MKNLKLTTPRDTVTEEQKIRDELKLKQQKEDEDLKKQSDN